MLWDHIIDLICKEKSTCLRLTISMLWAPIICAFWTIHLIIITNIWTKSWTFLSLIVHMRWFSWDTKTWSFTTICIMRGPAGHFTAIVTKSWAHYGTFSSICTDFCKDYHILRANKNKYQFKFCSRGQKGLTWAFSRYTYFWIFASIWIFASTTRHASRPTFIRAKIWARYIIFRATISS